MKSPYDWTRTRPAVEIARPQVPAVAKELRRGKSFILLAGRGMGKSVFLDQLRRELERDPDVRPFVISDPPMGLTVRSCMEKLAVILGVDPGEMNLAGRGVADLIQVYLSQDVPRNVVLLFDEFDRYARLPRDETDSPPGRDFFNSVEMMRRAPPESVDVGVLAAGSLGAFVFRDVLGSPFADRAGRLVLAPFGRDDIEELSRPFTEVGRALSENTLTALELASGGNPALVTYGLEMLWPLEEATDRDVMAAFSSFRENNSDFVRGFQISFANPKLSNAPGRVLELIRKGSGEVSRQALEKACEPLDSALHMNFEDVVTLLKAAGLVRVSGSVLSDPVAVQPITSILNLPEIPATAGGLRESLVQDLMSILARLHVSSVDFFRPATGKVGKQLVPEAVFSSFLSLGLNLLGWTVDREAQRVAGRTDVLIRRNGAPWEAVVEVKIWGRNDYKDVQRQVESYWTTRTSASAVVMLTDVTIEDWPGKYSRLCLGGLTSEDFASESPEAGSPVRLLRVSSQTPDGAEVEVDHFLLRLPRGRSAGKQC